MIQERGRRLLGKLLDIQFKNKDGEEFESIDAIGTLCEKNGSIWELEGMKFDGVDNWINLGLGKPTGLLGELTLSVWINPTTLGESNGGRIIDNGRLLVTVFAPNKIYFSSNGGGTVAYSSDNSITLGKWQHVTVTRGPTGVNGNVYINGTLTGAENQNTGAPGAGTTQTAIGNRENLQRAFSGKIGTIKVWSRILGKAEIQNEYLESGRKRR